MTIRNDWPSAVGSANRIAKLHAPGFESIEDVPGPTELCRKQRQAKSNRKPTGAGDDQHYDPRADEDKAAHDLHDSLHRAKCTATDLDSSIFPLSLKSRTRYPVAILLEAELESVHTIHSDINTGQRLGHGSTRIHTDQTHMGNVDEHLLPDLSGKSSGWLA
jgi:hypothetical protein